MAGTQVVDQIQLGNNGTAANNFVIKTMNDGTMKIQRGNIGGSLTDVLSVDANGVVTPVKFDLGQTEQDVTASRAITTVYTNNTGKPIVVGLILAIGAGQSASFNIGGASYATLSNVGSSTTSISGTFLIRNGQTYSVTGSGFSISKWTETR